MSKTEPAPNLVDLDQLRMTGTRTVEVKVRGVALSVTESLEDDDSVDREIGRARMRALAAGRASQRAMALPAGESDEAKAAASDLAQLTESMDALQATVTFDRRRIACQRIATRFVAWSLADKGAPVPLDFDGLYDGEVKTLLLEEIYQAVRSEPVVGE